MFISLFYSPPSQGCDGYNYNSNNLMFGPFNTEKLAVNKLFDIMVNKMKLIDIEKNVILIFWIFYYKLCDNYNINKLCELSITFTSKEQINFMCKIIDNETVNYFKNDPELNDMNLFNEYLLDRINNIELFKEFVLLFKNNFDDSPMKYMEFTVQEL